METIKSTQVGRQIDNNLRTFLDIMAGAEETENEGKILYVRNGEWAFEDGEALFDVTELT